MNYIINKKNFEFMKNFLESPVDFGGFLFHQVGECSLSDGGAIKSHCQECYEVSYVVSGCGTFIVDGVSYQVSQGDVHLLAPGKIHEITTDYPGGFRFAYMGFSFDDSVNDMDNAKNFYSMCTSHITKDKGDIYNLMRILINEWYDESKLDETVIVSLLRSIIILVSRVFSGSDKTKYNPEYTGNILGRNIYSIIHYIDNNATEIEGVKSLADRFGYTPDYLSHLFKNKTGQSVQSYIIDKKIKLASDLLENTDCSITEIADRLNYASVQSFCKAFRKARKYTPSEFRKMKKDKSYIIS